MLDFKLYRNFELKEKEIPLDQAVYLRKDAFTEECIYSSHVLISLINKRY